MNTSQNKIPIAEFREVKFVLAVLLLKTDLNPATQQRERRPENITRRDGFAREWRILRAGSEGVSSFGPLVQSFGHARHVCRRAAQNACFVKLKCRRINTETILKSLEKQL